MQWLDGTRRAIIAHQIRTDGPLRATKIADALGLTHPTIISHLRKLRDQGLVTDQVIPSFHGLWVDPKMDVLEEWHSQSRIDWRFPLVSRVPDLTAQELLIEWLDRAQAMKWILPSPTSRFDAQADPKQRITIGVYGSCARGDAGPKADLDIMVIDHGKKSGETNQLEFLAHETALQHDRTVDIQTIAPADLEQLPEAFKDNLRQEMITVWSNDHETLQYQNALRALEALDAD